MLVLTGGKRDSFKTECGMRDEKQRVTTAYLDLHLKCLSKVGKVCIRAKLSGSSSRHLSLLSLSI